MGEEHKERGRLKTGKTKKIPKPQPILTESWPWGGQGSNLIIRCASEQKWHCQGKAAPESPGEERGNEPEAGLHSLPSAGPFGTALTTRGHTMGSAKARNAASHHLGLLLIT